MSQEQLEKNNLENSPDKSQGAIAPEKSLAEKRADRLRELENQLATFNVSGDPTLKEIANRQESALSEELAAMDRIGIKITESTRNLIYEELAARTASERKRFDELRAERAQLKKDILVDDFLEKIRELQLEVNIAELKKIITSSDILDLDRHANRQKIEINEESWDILWEKGGKDLKTTFGKLLRMELANSQYAEMLTDSTVDFGKAEEKNVLGQSVDLEDLSDLELVGLGVEKIKNIIRDMLTDQESRIVQGNFSNVLVSEKSSYVLKTMRKMDDEVDEKKQEQSFFSYSIFKEAFGEEFLPRQAVLKSQADGKVYVLQEKQDFDKSKLLKNGTVDELIENEEFSKIFEKKENREKFERFLSGIENLYARHQFVLDILGENVLVGFDDANNLDIKLLDYGGWQNDAENKWGDDHEALQGFIGKLRNFSDRMEMREEFEKENFKNIEFKNMSQLQCWDRIKDFDFASKFAGLEIVVIDDEEKWKSVYGSNDSKSSHNPKTIILKKEIFDRQDITDGDISWLIHEIGHIDFYNGLGENLDEYMEKYYQTGEYANSEMEQKAFEKQFQFLKSIGKTKTECVAVIENYLEKTFAENQEGEKSKERGQIMGYINMVY